MRRASKLRSEIAYALGLPPAWRAAVRQAYERAVNSLVEEQLRAMPISRLREATRGPLVLRPIEAAGYRTIGEAEAAGIYRLQTIRGVGHRTAAEVVASAARLRATLKENTRLYFDTDRRPYQQTALLRALLYYESAERVIGPIRSGITGMAANLDLILPVAMRAANPLRLLFLGHRAREEAYQAIARLAEFMASAELEGDLADLAAALSTRPPTQLGDENALWRDYRSRAATYNGLLIEAVDLEQDESVIVGNISDEITSKVLSRPLDTTFLTVTLRGYQAFAARFLLTQGRVLVGDEMGLGKTVEALAAIAHLHAQGATHSFVVCPASVLMNWLREIGMKTNLRPYRLHGQELEWNLRAWKRNGGVAVTTYNSLRAVRVPADIKIALLVADEAHYVKNPEAQRSKRIRRWSDAAERTLFLSGTPLENRVSEFQTLIGYLQPSIAKSLNVLGLDGNSVIARNAVAPVYLRRNKEDVLRELPPLIEIEDWVEFGIDDGAEYRAAVVQGNFMRMRRAAYSPGTPEGSAKLERLVEIVSEALANDRKVVVFSYFLDVLASVEASLGASVVGKITGSVPPPERQRIVDDFTQRLEAAVLVSQVEAGGVGMNLQAASVVILAEPQWKPSTEMQAIGRCHRIGQAEPVEVHRLLAKQSVDERMREILRVKRELFNEYARRSKLAEMNAAAVDVSEVETDVDVGKRVEIESRIIEIERRRLGIDR